MNKIRIVSLYSGSVGNATLIETAKTSILIDAGKSARALCASLRQVGSDAERLDAVFVTHEHTDHISALEVFLKKHRIPVHMTSFSAQRIPGARMPNLRDCIREHTPAFTERVGDLTVKSFVLSHDSAMCVGYTVETDFGYRFGVATDTGYITDGMSCLDGCDSVMIESNHNVDMLLCGPYPAELKHRIRSKHGHLSNDDCAALACRLARSGTKHFMLAHLSEENNTPESATCTVGRALSPFGDVCLCVAKPREETVLVSHAEN